MTNQQCPITPPPELFAEWLAEAKRLHPRESTGFIAGAVARLAYQAGADQELDACCEWVAVESIAAATELRAWRRPKPSSLKEQALVMLENAWEGGHISNNAAQTIRRALEQLDD